MKFVGELDKKQTEHVNNCNKHLNDPERLLALQSTTLLDTPREETFDRLCRLAARILDVPLTIVSLVDNKRQFFKADYGLPHPFRETRNLPIDFSLCRYTMAGDAIISNDAFKDPFLKCHPSTIPWGIGSLIVLPLITPEGHVLGTFCCIQPTPREWSDFDHEVMKELTASIMTEINLRGQLDKMRVEQNMRDTFVAAMTHDLRTPVTVAKMSAQMILKKFPENSDIQKHASKIVDSSNRSEKMIQNLLDVNQIKSGNKLSVNPEVCDLNELINYVIHEVACIYGERFIYNVENSIQLKADKAATQRVVENLISNAAKYGDMTKPVEIFAAEKDNFIEIEVKNFGNPISEEDQKNIFNPFQRTIDAQQSNQKGWGLGLPLVKGLVEAHDGAILVSSSLSEGTSFRVLFPKA